MSEDTQNYWMPLPNQYYHYAQAERNDGADSGTL